MARTALTALDRGITVELDVGDELSVILPEDSGAGYLWTLESIDGEAVTLDKSEPGPQPTSSVGGRRPRELTFRAVRGGRAEIHLVHRRPWGGAEPEADRFDTTVVVAEATS